MTPKRPTELVTASQALSEAWGKRDQLFEAGDMVGVQAMNLVTDLLTERYNTLYHEWQILGGTSDIDSLTFPAPYVDILEAQQFARDCGCFTCVSNLRNIEADDEANKRYFTDKLIADRHNAAKHTTKEVM